MDQVSSNRAAMRAAEARGLTTSGGEAQKEEAAKTKVGDHQRSAGGRMEACD